MWLLLVVRRQGLTLQACCRVCVPREGEAGDNLYVIQSGVYEAIKGQGAGERVLFRYEEKGAFGELALMYNCPRAASVRVSQSPSWHLAVLFTGLWLHLRSSTQPRLHCARGAKRRRLKLHG